MPDDKPGYIERMQISEERRVRRGTLRTLVITAVVMLLFGWGFMALWVIIRSNLGRWGRERPRGPG